MLSVHVQIREDTKHSIDKKAEIEWTGNRLSYIQSTAGNPQTIGYYCGWQYRYTNA